MLNIQCLGKGYAFLIQKLAGKVFDIDFYAKSMQSSPVSYSSSKSKMLPMLQNEMDDSNSSYLLISSPVDSVNVS